MRTHGPDLVVDTIRPFNSRPRPGQEVDFQVRVHNQGDEAAGPFTLRFEDDDRYRDEYRFSGLEAGAREDAELRPLTVRDSQPIVLQAHVDDRNEVDETRENNNLKTYTLIPRP